MTRGVNIKQGCYKIYCRCWLFSNSFGRTYVRNKFDYAASSKGALAPSGMRRQVPARRRFDNLGVRLGIRVRNLQPRSAVRSFRIVDDTRILSYEALFGPFFALITYYLSCERSLASRSDSKRDVSSA